MGNTIAFPMIGLGLSTAAMTSGFDQAESIVKSGMGKVAGAVASNPIKPMFDTSALTKGLEQALEKVEKLRGKSVDLISGMNAAARMNVGGSMVNSQFAGMVGASPGASRGPDAFLSGMQKAADEAAKAAKAFSAFDGALALAKKSGGGVDSLIAGMSSSARLNVGGSAVSSQFAGMLGSTIAGAKGADPFLAVMAKAKEGQQKALTEAKSGGFSLMNLSVATIALDAALNILGKIKDSIVGFVTGMLGVATKAEAGRDDVMAGGYALISGGSMTGTMARLESTIGTFWESVWNAFEANFDIQGWIESFRGSVAGVTALIQGLFGTGNDLMKNPERLMESFRKGGIFIISVFESIGKISLEIHKAFLDVVKTVKKFTGSGGEFTQEQEDKIRVFQNQNLKIKKVRENLMGFLPPGMGIAQPDQLVPLDRAEAINAMKKRGLLPSVDDNAGFAALDKIVKDAMGFLKGAEVPKADEKVFKDAVTGLESFTASLRKTADPLYALQKAAEDDQKAIDDMVNKMGKEIDGLAILDAMDAADIAQGGRVQNFLNQALSQQKAASISTAAETGSQALADAVGRAMAGPGGKDIQGQIKDAIDAQLKETKDQTRILDEMNDNWKRFKPGQVPQARGI